MNLEPYDVKNILRNIELVFKSGSSEKLSKKSYKFLYLMSGFIAHYNLYGFQETYKDLRLLIHNINYALPIEKDVAERDIADPKHNGYGLPYCQSKLEIVKGLEKIIPEYKDKIEKGFRAIEIQETKQEIKGLQEKLANL